MSEAKPKGFVRADQTIDALSIYLTLCDLWQEANAVDTVIGRPEVLLAKVATLRDQVGRAVNATIPLLDEANGAATRDVLAERARQISAEGWTPEHDDEHRDGTIARAAAVYCLCEGPQRPGEPSMVYRAPGWSFNPLAAIWPQRWHFNAKDRRSNLVRAGALILAEIERLDRAAS